MLSSLCSCETDKLPAMDPFILLVAASAAASPQSGPTSRCGWLDNPSPANWSLFDRDGEWLIGMMGDYQAPGIDNVPDFPKSAWVRRNAGSYGYGCVCMKVTTDRATHRITNILSAVAKPLRLCRADRKLPKL
jgi:hypothetical protein